MLGNLNKKFILSNKLKQEINKDRKEIEKILTGKDNRMILIVGPCSAWPSLAVIDYARKLKKVSEKVKPFLKIILRVYTQKPRTINGWSGIAVEPILLCLRI
jgi:3-deoxy-7-phosphoheptulonate synthase